MHTPCEIRAEHAWGSLFKVFSASPFANLPRVVAIVHNSRKLRKYGPPRTDGTSVSRSAENEHVRPTCLLSYHVHRCKSALA